MENKTTYTQKEYAQIKGVTPQYIYKLMKKQKLKTPNLTTQKFKM